MQLWKVKTLPRVKNFLWWACREVFPCEANLRSRKIINEDTRACCSLEEDGIHVLFQSTNAQKAWTLIPGIATWGRLSHSRFDFFALVMRHSSSEEVCLWAGLLHAI